MKCSPAYFAALLGAALPFAPLALHAQAPAPVPAADHVRIEVKVVDKNERKKADPKQNVETTTQERTLEIEISGHPKAPETRTGKWMIYAHDQKDKSLTIIESGDFKIELPASGPQKIESTKATMTFTPEHPAPAGGGGKGGAKAPKKIEATGNKYAGYGVVVNEGNAVVDEAWDPLGMKAEAAK
jgi:hypothetical protein